ncbi:hypothetical protein MMPV_003828 [Pyropia vietnamensis]
MAALAGGRWLAARGGDGSLWRGGRSWHALPVAAAALATTDCVRGGNGAAATAAVAAHRRGLATRGRFPPSRPLAVHDAAVAVLYQATPPPPLGVSGGTKPPKRGGYADSGADIAAALVGAVGSVVTPVASPRLAVDADWVWPDTAAGVAAAVDAGASVLVERYDDKAVAAAALRRRGIPVPPSLLVTANGMGSRGSGRKPAGGETVCPPTGLPLLPTASPVHVDDLDEQHLAAAGVGLPAIVKPLRGRGSAGVIRVDSVAAIGAAIRAAPATTGGVALVEAYLPGEEVTITIMPPGIYAMNGGRELVWRHTHWALPPVARVGHVRGVVPYSGDVPVTANSAVVTTADPAYAAVGAAAAAAAAALGATAIMRIDARRSATAASTTAAAAAGGGVGGSSGGGGGGFALIDVNWKPNMTAAGRPGRDDQDSLVVLAAQAAGWTYQELLLNALRQAWEGGEGGDPADDVPSPFTAAE